MRLRLIVACVAGTLLVAGAGLAAEDVQWIRVTVLLEAGSGTVPRAEESLIPGGVYSLEEVEKRGQEAIDQEILRRIRFLGDSMREVEDSMRLASLMARQYYLPLEVGKQAVLPVIDINPRIGIVFTPQRFVGNRTVCKVQFLEPEGPPGGTDFTGEPISLRLQDADLKDVIRVFSQVTSTDILLDPSVEGKVSVDLREVPWDQALDLVLRTNNLAWIDEDGVLKIVPLDKLSLSKRVRTDATINLPRGEWGSATIASRGDTSNPTIVLVVESVNEQPTMVAERDGLVFPKRALRYYGPSPSEFADMEGELAVFRGTLNEEGRLSDTKVLASPSTEYGKEFGAMLTTWEFRTVLDEEGRKRDAVIGYGVRLEPPRALASIRTAEHVGVEVKVEPTSGGSTEKISGQYVITAFVKDLDTGEIIGAPRITTQKGIEAKVRTGFVAPSGAPTQFEMRVKISKDEGAVTCSWSMTTDGKVVASHSAEFKL